MAPGKSPRHILVVSGLDKVRDNLAEMLPPREFHPITLAHSAGEAKRILLSTHVDIVIINSPLPDELGVELALDLSDDPLGVLLLVKSDLYDQVSYNVEDSGVLTLQKPNSRQAIYTSLKLLSALSARLGKMEKKNKSLQEKMADIRAVNRAKWLLIENLNMREQDAHYFIEKRAMDARVPRREIAESIIRTYDK